MYVCLYVCMFGVKIAARMSTWSQCSTRLTVATRSVYSHNRGNSRLRGESIQPRPEAFNRMHPMTGEGRHNLDVGPIWALICDTELVTKLTGKQCVTLFSSKLSK